MSIKPIAPPSVLQVHAHGGVSKAVAESRAIQAQANQTGAASNLSAQKSVMNRQQAERLLGGQKRSNALLVGLTPAINEHGEDSEEHDASDGRGGQRGAARRRRPPPQR